MHLLSYLSFGIALSSSFVAGQRRNNYRRYANATVTPTSCPTDIPTKAPSTLKCPITDLPNPTDSAITYLPSTTATTWRKPPIDANWQIILDREIEYTFPTVVSDNVRVYDIDLNSTNATFQSWHDTKTPDKYLICYFSAGTSEADRDDINCFNPNPGAQAYGCNYGGNSPDENWLNTTSREVRRVMLRRLDLAVQNGCDAVDPDNVDGYSNENGIGETVHDASDYMDFLITEAHNRGLGIGLKNADALAAMTNLTDRLDFAVVEECFTSLTSIGGGKFRNACSNWAAFYQNTTVPKPVYNIEYPVTPGTSATPTDRSPWNTDLVASRCAAWATETASQNLKVNLKNYYKVDCPVARCSPTGANPTLTPTDATYTIVCGASSTQFHTTVALVTPDGCHQSALPAISNCGDDGPGDSSTTARQF